MYYRDGTRRQGDGEGNAKLARVYMEAAAQASPRQLALNQETGMARKELAAAISRICRGEELLDSPGRTIVDDGEEYTYHSYWEDLQVLVDPDLIGTVAGATSRTDTNYLLSLYRRAAGALLDRMSGFHRTQEEVLAMARQIRENCMDLQEADADAFIPGSEAADILDVIRAQLEIIEEDAATLPLGEGVRSSGE